MEFIDILGLMAGTLCTISFLPQVIKTWRSKSAKDVSLGMFLIFAMGISLWLIYGIIIRSFPIVTANAATLVLTIVILIMKAKYK